LSSITGIRACVFDAYGTLFDVHSATQRCTALAEAMRGPLSATWRDKQLQYTWLRSLQGRYVDFWQVTGEALDFALETHGLDDPALRTELLRLYRTLAAYPEVPGVLRDLREAGFALAILSNGSPDMLASAVASAGLDGLFDQVLSVDAAGVFKTDPRTYQLAVDALNVPVRAISFQSSNGWDAHAAADFGLRAVWCNRTGQVRERLPGSLDCVITSLAELPGLIR
jgi:2-haloacid dehalogenase